jgi:glycosyltransferase involved in cell wall biosynthesis
VATPEASAIERPELSVVVLCYRAGAAIAPLLESLYALVADAGIEFELVLVANYWPDTGDETPSYVDAFGRTHGHVRVVAEPKHGGMGWDMRSGLSAATGRVLIVIDGDAQNPVEDVLRMYEAMTGSGGAPVMKGRRVLRHDGPYRRLISTAYNVLFRLMFRTRGLWDINGKPKGLVRDVYDRMSLESDDWFIDAEIVLAARRLDVPVAELPVTFRASERRSFVRASAIGEFLVNMTRYRLTNRAQR